LREALDCFAAQDVYAISSFCGIFPTIQSTDRQKKVCPKLRLIADENRNSYRRQAENLRGQLVNFQLCFLQHTRGEYFKWASCDDGLPPYVFWRECVEALGLTDQTRLVVSF